MSDTEDIFAENSSDETEFASANSTADDPGSIVVEETEDEEEDESHSQIENEERSWEDRAVESDDQQTSAGREVLERMKKRQSRRMSFHPKHESSSSSEDSEDSDDHEVEMVVKPGPIKVSIRAKGDVKAEESSYCTSDEDQSLEERALSPTTRMSMTGVRPEDLSSDSDEEESEDEEDVVTVRKMKKRNVILSDSEGEVEVKPEPASSRSDPMQSIVVSDESAVTNTTGGTAESVKAEQHSNGSLANMSGGKAEQDSFENSLASGGTAKSAKEEQDSFDNSLALHSFHAGGGNRDSIETKLSSTAVSEDIDTSISAGRPSFSVRQSIGDKLSSTMIDVVSNQQPQPQETNDSSSVMVIQKSSEIVALSSDDEEDVKPLMPTKQPTVQPTIQAAFGKQRVSQSMLDAKQRELATKQKSLEVLEKLLQMKNELPDKGKALLIKIVNLREEIKALSMELNGLQVQDGMSVREEIKKTFESSNVSGASSNATLESANGGKMNNYSWQDIEKGTDAIQPKHTGKQGIATFENQKTLTLDRLRTLHKSIETCPTEDTYAEPPVLLKVSLMAHQLHALAWLLWRERQKPRGGILADDMGLGKTLSMISLILKAAELDDPDKQLEEDSDEADEDGADQNNWKSKGRRDYYAGGTLVVCPASLLRQWEGEINTRVKRNSLAVNVYHGSNRDNKSRHLAKYDVVITTYAIVSREVKSERVGLFGVKWERVILDEAHTIRNHKAALSVACCQLRGTFRWVLTGTPIQNKEMDMYALLKFLKCTPFDDLTHWKKWIDNKTAGGMDRLNTILKSLMLRRTKQQLNEQGALQCLPQKDIQVIQVKLGKDEMNVYQRVLLYSRTLFAAFLHQRAEKENAALFGAHGSRPTFAQSRHPNGAYDRVHQKLKKLHTKDEVKQHEILVLLLRLRQICCHPGLIQKMLDEDEEGNFDISGSEEESPELDLLEHLNKMKLSDSVDAENNSPDGPLRQLNISDELPENAEAISKASSKVMMKSNPVFDFTRVSSKVGAVLALLESKVLNTDDKAVVVSQWSSVLEILEGHLKLKGVATTALTGKVAVKLRNDIVVEFNKQGSGPQIMLLSLTAGGVGLNLVGGNHLLLVDLHWNPQLEAQAQDRVYRVGQQKPVYIWKFMCSDTVEQAISVLQQKKLDIADAALTGAKLSKGSKLSIDDLKSLFGM